MMAPKVPAIIEQIDFYKKVTWFFAFFILLYRNLYPPNRAVP